MVRSKILESSTHLLCLLLVTIFQAVTAISYSSYSSLCHFPVPSPDLHTGKHDHSRSTATARASDNLPRISTGHFSGGDDLLFAPDRPSALRSFSFSPRHSALTTDPAVVRLVATLVLEGYGVVVGSRRGEEHHHGVTFELEGFYSTATSSAELCMVGSGSYARGDGTDSDTDVHLSDAALRLRLPPRPANLSEPFVTGRLEGAGFRAITLVAYAAADDDHPDRDRYAETVASCPPPATPARDGQHVLGAGGFSCSRLRELLRDPYDLEYRHAAVGSSGGSSPLQLRHHHRIMYVNQMSCAADGGVRAYLAFLVGDHSDSFPSSVFLVGDHSDSFPSSVFLVGDEALVAEGFWDSSRSQLCLRACRVVVRAGAGLSSQVDLAVGECGIRVSFWFPGTWSFHDRKTVAGLVWNTSRGSDGGDTVMMSGTASLSRRLGLAYTGDLSDIKYNYTLVEKATEHYHSNPVLSKDRNGSFPGNHSCRDFVFRISLKEPELRGYGGSASPVTIGSTVVQGDRLMADDVFSQRVAAEVKGQRLLNVSYDLRYTVPHVNWRIKAEGVYDTKTGSLCMVGCQVSDNSLSDCQVLVTVLFATEARDREQERAVGTISSLRTKSDPLFFQALDFDSQAVHLMRPRESRMENEITMLEPSPALFAVVLILQLRHAKKHPEAVASMSITMLVVLALGSLVPLMLDFEPAIRALENRFDSLWMWYHIEPHRFPLRVGTMLAFLLQLRLLQLVLSARRPAEPGRGGDGSSAAAAAERKTLKACLLLHFLGAVLMLIANRVDGRLRLLIRATDPGDPSPSDVLVSYGGLVLDAFLLPQVISNAFSGAEARALSPWFYVGGTVIRAAPHAYDVYAGPRGHLFGGVALEVAVLLGVALLAVLLFVQQRVQVRGAFLSSSKRRSGAYRMVSGVPSC